MDSELDKLDDAPDAEEDFDLADSGADTAQYTPQKEGQEIDLKPDGGVKKLLVKAGEGWDKPETGDDVSVHYTGTLLDGTKFDSSLDRNEPFKFKLGQGQVIKGWDIGVSSMKKGEKATFTIAADYAYGQSGSPPTIPGGATLKFDVELLSWTSVKDIAGDGGLFKKVLQEGKKWEMPKADDEVLVKYEARLPNGQVVGKSPEEGVEFYVKDGHFCPAIATAVKTMHKGGKAVLTVKPQYGFGGEGREAEGNFKAVPPDSNLEVDLEVVSWKTVEKVTDDGKVIKKTLKDGEGYEKPNDMAKVKVRYTGKLEDGTIFEKRGYGDGNEFEFIADEEQVISGLDLAVLKMKKGEIASVHIPPEFGYGSVEHQGELATVPPNSSLEYELELVTFEKSKESWDMDNEEKLQTAAQRKDEGNTLFKAGKYERASKKYKKATKLIEYDGQFSDDEKKQSKALQASCNLNDAACKLKLKDYTEAVKLCSKVLEKETQNVKALFRRAQGYMGQQDYDLAEWDLKKALEIDPNSKDVKAEYRTLKLKIAEQNKREAKLYGNMFARLSKMEAKEGKKVVEVPEGVGDGSVKGQEPMETDEKIAAEQ